MYIDTHCHLSKEDYDIDKLVEECHQNHVDILIMSGCDKKGIKEGLEIIQKYKEIYMTVGFHPSEIETTTKEDIKWLEKIIKENKKIIGIGEIGLDYHWEKDKKEAQKNLFEQQLKLAEELNLPVVIHSRDATEDTIQILKKYKVKGTIHCFSGSKETAEIYIKMGYKLGIGGVVTFKNSKLKDVIKELPLHTIVLETDSPYLAPTPYRGEKNEPKYIPIIAEEISRIKQADKQEVESITTKNVYELYQLTKN